MMTATTWNDRGDELVLGTDKFSAHCLKELVGPVFQIMKIFFALILPNTVIWRVLRGHPIRLHPISDETRKD